MSIWDDPSMKVGGDFVKFENVGDTITGTVLAVGAHKWDDGSVSPQIIIETPAGEEKTITAGQIRLKSALAEKRPEIGDLLTITFIELEKRQGGKTLKHFDVQVKKGTGGFSSAPINAATPDLSHVDPAVLAALQSKLGAQAV